MANGTLILSVVCIISGTVLAAILDDTHLPVLLIGAGVTALTASTYKLNHEVKKKS